jgi:hypothetical protein
VSDWYKFTEESLLAWPAVRLDEVRVQIEQRMMAEPAMYVANRVDMENKIRMLSAEAARRKTR